MRKAILFLFLVPPFLTQAQFKIITIGENSVSASPSVSINRKNAANVVVTCGEGVYASDDEGTTWNRYEIPEMKGSAEHRVISDRKGDLFDFFVVINPESRRYDKIICQSSKDGGKTWATLGNIAVTDSDIRFPRVCIYNKSGEIMLTWTQYDKWGSSDQQHQSNIMHAVSKDGKKWSKPLRVNQVSGDCLDRGQSPKGAIPAINTKELMFVAWAVNNKFYIDRSFNKGVTWLSNDIQIADQPAGWSFQIPGVGLAEGLPEFYIDNSASRYNGTLFLAWADQRNGADDTDIWFLRSVNYGDNWTTPLRVNDDSKGKHQYSPSMTIDQADGTVYIIYYDRRHYDDDRTDLYLAYSTDNGTSFKNVRITEEPITPALNEDFKNYISVDAFKGTVIPVWTTAVNGNSQIQTTVIKRDDLLKIADAK